MKVPDPPVATVVQAVKVLAEATPEQYEAAGFFRNGRLVEVVASLTDTEQGLQSGDVLLLVKPNAPWDAVTEALQALPRTRT